MNVHETEITAEERIFSKLKESTFFQTYREAFEAATGLPLDLVPAAGGHAAGGHAGAERAGKNEFCRLLNEGAGVCGRCAEAGRALACSGEGGATTVTCFAKLRETQVPVRSGERAFALLVTGRVATEPLADELPEPVRAGIAEVAASPEERRRLETAWRGSPVTTREQYFGGVTLLATFALQLSDVLNRLLIEESHAEPEVVVKAKRFVNAHLEDRISLERVSKHVGVSPFYFCKVFKQSVGMTLTEYVNRRRVEWAKRRLFHPRARVTEVAFDVGFQSISQFNRSFLKYVGESPTRYRERKAHQTRVLNAAA